MKKCKKCGESKSLEDFTTDKRNKDGRAGVCRSCNRSRQAAWERKKYQHDEQWKQQRLSKSKTRRKKKYQEDPEYRESIRKEQADWRSKPENKLRKKAIDKAYREANKDKAKEYHKEWYRSPIGKFYEVRAGFRKYGVDDVFIMDLIDKQKGCCALCEVDFGENTVRKNGRTPYVVDHCHDTGKVRGLLCQACNIAYGYFEGRIRDNIGRFENYDPYVTK